MGKFRAPASAPAPAPGKTWLRSAPGSSSSSESLVLTKEQLHFSIVRAEPLLIWANITLILDSINQTF